MPQKSNLELMMESMLMAQQKQDDYIKQLATKVDMLTTHNRMLETQIAQKAAFSSPPSDRLPSKPEPNLKEQCNTMLLRGRKLPKGPKDITNNESSHDRNEDAEKVEKEISTPSKKTNDATHKPDEVPKDPKTISLKRYILPLPFPQRMTKAKLDMQFGKFLDVLKKPNINIPFTEVLTQMPSYAKFLKEIMSNKRKL